MTPSASVEFSDLALLAGRAPGLCGECALGVIAQSVERAIAVRPCALALAWAFGCAENGCRPCSPLTRAGEDRVPTTNQRWVRCELPTPHPDRPQCLGPGSGERAPGAEGKVHTHRALSEWRCARRDRVAPPLNARPRGADPALAQVRRRGSGGAH